MPQRDVEAGAQDQVLDGANLNGIEALVRQKIGGEIRAAAYVRGGVFGAGARHGLSLKITGVVQQHRQKGEFKVAAGQDRFGASQLAAAQEECQAEGSLRACSKS